MKNRIGSTAAITLGVFGVLTLGACTDDDDPVDPGDFDQEFTMNFQALNESGVSGSGTLVVSEPEDNFILALDLEGIDPGITVELHLRMESTCPTSGADTNGDGFIDWPELSDASGEVILPIDDDLTNETVGAFPISSPSGGVLVQEDVSLAAVEGEAREDPLGEPQPEPGFARLDADEEFSPEIRVITVHGVDPSTDLPESVGSLGDRPATETLPIACAPINRAQTP